MAQTVQSGHTRCAQCRLKFHIEIEEPRCPKCNYLLHMLTEPRCPECGGALGAEELAASGPETPAPETAEAPSGEAAQADQPPPERE